MSDLNTIFILTRDDVIGCAKQMGIPAEAITDEVLRQVKKGVEYGLDCWPEVVKTALAEAINEVWELTPLGRKLKQELADG